MAHKSRFVRLMALAVFAGAFSFAATAATTPPDPIIQQLQADGLAQQTLAAKVKGELTTLGVSVQAQNNQVATLGASNATLTASNATLRATNTILVKQVADLKKQLPGGGGITTTTTTTIPPTPPPPDTGTGDVLTDRLGKSYAEYDHTGEAPFPVQYLRAVIPTPPGSYRPMTSEGLGDYISAGGDYSSTQGQILFVPDVALTVDKTAHDWVINSGIGVARLTLENMSNSSLGIFPQLDSVPDAWAYQWVQYNNQPIDVIGHPIGVARGYGRWANSALVLFSNGFIGTVSTVTSFSPTGGTKLPDGKKPTSITVTSGNEFTLVTCIDVATGKGQLAVFANWTGKSIQQTAGYAPFYHDWPEPHPGLPNVAIYCGFKLLGFVDLGINAPTAVSAVASQGADRVNGADGNAGTLGDKDLNDPATRLSFASKPPEQRANGDNSTFISDWGFAVVISKSESKAVYVDMRALFAAYKTQYTTTQALYDATKPPGGRNWWEVFGLGDTDWPYTFTGKPEWAPKVTTTIDVSSPTAVLVTERGDGALAVASEDGTIRFWTGGPANSTTPTPAGSLKVGRNVTCLAYDKYPSQYGTREGRGFFAVSRGDRSISLVNGWGSAATVSKTLRDGRLADPVNCEVSDTHGINVGVLTVCDFTGKQVLNYRYTEAELVNYGDVKYPIGPTTTGTTGTTTTATYLWECDGVLPLPGKPFAVSGTNVN